MYVLLGFTSAAPSRQEILEHYRHRLSPKFNGTPPEPECNKTLHRRIMMEEKSHIRH